MQITKITRRAISIFVCMISIWPFSIASASHDLTADKFRIISIYSDQCLGMDNGSIDNTARVVHASCQPPGYNQYQLFTFKLIGNGYHIVAQHSGKCVDATWDGSSNNGQIVHQYYCIDNDRTPNQIWNLRPVGRDGYQVVASHNSKCLDLSRDGLQGGGQLVQNDCLQGEGSQVWRIQPVDQATPNVVPVSAPQIVTPPPRAMHNHIEQRDYRDVPSVPQNMFVSPYEPNTMVPVIVHDGLRWWPMTNVDNAFLVNLVAFDQNDRLVKSVRFMGDRYVNDIKDGPNGKLYIYTQSGTMVFHRSDLNQGGELYPYEFLGGSAPFPSTFLRGQVANQQTGAIPAYSDTTVTTTSGSTPHTGSTTSTGDASRIILAAAGSSVETGSLQYAEGGDKGKWIFTETQPGSTYSLPKELTITRKKENKHEAFGRNEQGRKIFYDILFDEKQIKNVSDRNKVEFSILRTE